MNKKMNGKMGQYLVMQAVIRSALCFLAVFILSVLINVVLKKDGVNVLFFDMFLVVNIGMGSGFDIQSRLCGKAHIFTNSRKKIFRNCMKSVLVSSLVFALCRTFYQNAFYGEYVREFMEDETEKLVFTRIGMPEMFIYNYILIMAICVILLWCFGMGKKFGFLPIGIDIKDCSVQMQYLAAVRKKRRNLLKRISRAVYMVLEFVFIVAVEIFFTYVYYWQLQWSFDVRLRLYAAVLAVGVVFFLLAKRRFRPEYM